MEQALASSNHSQREPVSLAITRGISVLRRIQSQRKIKFPVLVCMYRGTALPPFCAKMERNPDPSLGHKLDDLPEILPEIIALNPSVHDGAILAQRSGSGYIISGWSYRLYPPQTALVCAPNKGSAYNSCLAMSVVAGIDATLLLGSSGLSAFARGIEYSHKTGDDVNILDKIPRPT